MLTYILEPLKNPAHWPGFFLFGSLVCGPGSACGLCRATFFSVASKCAGSSSQPRARAASMNIFVCSSDSTFFFELAMIAYSIANRALLPRH